MKVQMINGLAAIPAAINHDTITSVELELFRQVANYKPDMGDQTCIVVVERRYGCDGLLRNYKHVNRRLCRDIMKCQASIVLVNDFCGDLFVDNSLKSCLFGHEG